MDVAIDVATLRGATNLLRRTPRADKGRFVDLDIASLGSLLEALCFADSVKVPELGHHSGGELASSVGSGVQSVPLTGNDLRGLTREASAWLWSYSDPASLLELVDGRPTYKQSTLDSDYALILDALGFAGKRDPDASRLAASLRRATETSVRPVAEARDMRGRPIGASWQTILRSVAEIDTPAPFSAELLVTPKLVALLRNLAWLLFRARCYLLWSNEHGITYMPHPLRGSLAGYAAAVPLDERELPTEGFARLYLRQLEAVHQEAAQRIAEVSGTTLFQLQFPCVLPYVVKRAGGVERVLDVAYEVRESRGARAFRTRMTSLEAEVAGGDLRAGLKLASELGALTRTIRRDLGLTERDSTISTTLTVGPPGLSVALGGQRPAPRLRGLSLAADAVGRPWLLLLRNMSDALASSSSLGSLFEILYRPPAEPRGS